MKQKPTREPVANEATNGLKNKNYTVAMARTSEPHSATAQFFINVADNDFLDYTAPSANGWGYCVFGKVVGGQDVVDRIHAVPTGNSGFHQNVPKDDVVIVKAEEHRVDAISGPGGPSRTPPSPRKWGLTLSRRAETRSDPQSPRDGSAETGLVDAEVADLRNAAEPDHCRCPPTPADAVPLDLHLSPDRPEALAAFHAFAAGPARAAAAVYILGDLFDWWVGDDQMARSVRRDRSSRRSRHPRPPACRCSSAAVTATSCWARDFAAAAGATLLPELPRGRRRRRAARCFAMATSCAPTTPSTRRTARACATPRRRRGCCASPTSSAARSRGGCAARAATTRR